MDSVSAQECIECYYKSVLANDFKIYTGYKGKYYVSTCVKSVAMESSIVIKNALDSEDSNVFHVPDNNEIEPEAFKSILNFLHISTITKCNIEMKDEKNIQHMLLICNWFGFSDLYSKLIENYKTLLKKSARTLNMFTQIDALQIDAIHMFLETEQHNQSDEVHDQNMSYDDFDGYYNPIRGLITGDKLNDSELIDFSLSLFDFNPSCSGVYNLFGEICELLMKHLMRERTKEKICLKLSEMNEIYKQNQPEELRFTFSENYVRKKIYDKLIILLDELHKIKNEEHPFQPESESD
jgi:hypothetical protein